jgi:hypothetical protein
MSEDATMAAYGRMGKAVSEGFIDWLKEELDDRGTDPAAVFIALGRMTSTFVFTMATKVAPNAEAIDGLTKLFLEMLASDFKQKLGGVSGVLEKLSLPD